MNSGGKLSYHNNAVTFTLFARKYIDLTFAVWASSLFIFNFLHWRKLDNAAFDKAFDRHAHIIVPRIHQVSYIQASHGGLL